MRLKKRYDSIYTQLLICEPSNKFSEANLVNVVKRTVKIFASRCGGNLIEFDIAVRHAVRHLDSMYVRAGSRNRIIRSHKSRVPRCVVMRDA